MKILLLSTSKFTGAGKATSKIYNSLRSIGIDCEHKVLLNNNNTLKFRLKKISNIFKSKTNTVISNLQRGKNSDFRSLSLFPTNVSSEINNSNFDIIHLTWINEFLSIEDIGRIKKPIVWSLCDMWPITGMYHYDEYNKDAFWREKEFEKFKFSKFDLNKWIINRKKKSWKNNINLVAPSQWLYDCAKDSTITKNFPIKKLPWPINRKIFKKMHKDTLRKEFNLPLDKKIIIFNTFSGIYNKRKGWDLFIEAIQHTKSDFEIVVIGHEENKKNLEKLIKKKIHWMGKFDDDIKISKILNCGDIFLLPSRADALPQTGLEAQSCGLPLVTFNSNGLKDLVDHKIDGFHAEPFNPKSLSVGIDWILQDTKISKKLSENSIIKATNKWDSEVVALEYKKIYSNLM